MVVIKHRYIPGRRKQSQGGNVVSIGKALAHMNYIQHRPGEDREPGGRDMFNEHGDRIDAKEMRKAIRELGDSRVVVHKLTLAPEINPQDKKAFTREVMQKLGQDMGRDLQWFGVEHNNTDHHHIHVVVLGRDSNGTEVRIGLKDIDKARDHGERYLERCHPQELERELPAKDTFRILIVDNLEHTDQLKEACKEAGHSVVAAQSIKEAFAFLDGKDHADVIICAAFLEDESVFEFLARLKKDPIHKNAMFMILALAPGPIGVKLKTHV